MKKTVVALSIFTLLVVVAASTAATHKLAVNVPFDFYVGDDPLSAGRYVIDVGRAPGSGVIVIASARPGKQAFITTTPGDRAAAIDKTQLVFHRYGDTYFLTEVWDGTLAGVRRLHKSRTEAELARVHAEPPTKLALVIAPRR